LQINKKVLVMILPNQVYYNKYTNYKTRYIQ
jgi:hypothetical protein